jgi:hypothetical protein
LEKEKNIKDGKGIICLLIIIYIKENIKTKKIMDLE